MGQEAPAAFMRDLRWSVKQSNGRGSATSDGEGRMVGSRIAASIIGIHAPENPLLTLLSFRPAEN